MLRKSKEGLLSNYREHVHRTAKIDVELILSRGLRFKRLLSEGQYDLVSQELDDPENVTRGLGPDTLVSN